MSMHDDMVAPLVVLARVSAALAQNVETRALAAKVAAAAAVLADVADRVAVLDANPVPAHWLPQRAPTQADYSEGAVVSMLERRLRAARAMAQ